MERYSHRWRPLAASVALRQALTWNTGDTVAAEAMATTSHHFTTWCPSVETTHLSATRADEGWCTHNLTSARAQTTRQQVSTLATAIMADFPGRRRRRRRARFPADRRSQPQHTALSSLRCHGLASASPIRDQDDYFCTVSGVCRAPVPLRRRGPDLCRQRDRRSGAATPAFQFRRARGQLKGFAEARRMLLSFWEQAARRNPAA